MAENSRAAAARALAPVIAGKSSLDDPLARQLQRVKPRDQALLKQLCYGTLRDYYRLDWILGKALKRPLKARDSDVHALLACGLHQLLDLRIPDHAAIGETVEACRSLGKSWATGLVNGVLRRCRREGEALLQDLPPEVALNHPGWLIAALQNSWPGDWEAIVAANNLPPPMCLRVNHQKISTPAYLEQLNNAGIDAVASDLVDTAVRLNSPTDVTALPGFGEGQVSVQDEAAQLAAPLLDAAPGHRILDACAAPGGKTCHVLESHPSTELIAMDIDGRRLERVQENLDRLSLRAKLLMGDGASPPGELQAGSFDRILVDAPCSGSGVIRRHPDIKLLRRESDIAGLQRQQLQILQGLWPLLRPGGQLLYVTCSVLPEENAMVVEEFARSREDVTLNKIEAEWGEVAGAGRQLLTAVDGPDGLFFARLERGRG